MLPPARLDFTASVPTGPTRQAFFVRVSQTFSDVNILLNLVRVAVEEVDAVPRVGGLAFAHPPFRKRQRQGQRHNRECGRETTSMVVRCMDLIGVSFSAVRNACGTTARQRLRMAPSRTLLQTLTSRVRGVGQAQNGLNSFKL